MFAYLEGRLVEKNPAYAILDVGGVGYTLEISLNTYSALPEPGQKVEDSPVCRLHTHFIVREDAQLLYGFAGEEERRIFRSLITVSGVGANTARMLLSSLSPGELYDAIINERVNTLKAVKGIGAKSAQRIIVDLRDKLAKDEQRPEILEKAYNTHKEEALSGLTMLGFSKNVAEKALDKIISSASENDKQITVEYLIKEALKIL
ncbi:MAG: Holliday junction branch migration protein RuvA [Bacteroidales bacterium]|nr:Holliday junction branch migration protein RuvA [Bacteroidales bacterium]